VYSHGVPRHAIGDVEVQKDLTHGQATTKQVENAREEHPTDIVDSVVEVDYQATRLLAGWGTQPRHSKWDTYTHWHTTACARQNWLC
jgi:hypothetical protein